MRHAFVRVCAALLCAAFVFISSGSAIAQASGAIITGLVIDQKTALPVTGATVTVRQDTAVVASSVTDASGRYTVSGIAPGIYAITIGATGYDSSASNGTVVTSGTTTVSTTLSRSATSAAGTVIGRVGNSTSALSAATTISQEISMSDLTRTGQIRISDQLGTLPGVNRSTSSSVGDDTSLNLRGFGSDETASLLDGHPVGPLGVGSGGFNFSLGPAYGLSKVDVTYGSGAQGLFGSDTIGGAVNFVTINPTAKPEFSFQQQIGGFGISSTGITATGTLGKLGYAFAGGRLGTYGNFFPGNTAQSARPDNVSSSSVSPNGACAGSSNDVSLCNLLVNTYAVSGNTQQTVGLGKLTYDISPATKIRATAYDAVQWSDSTGNGDNDFLPFSTRLGQIQSGPSNCVTSTGTPGYTVTTDPIAGTSSCFTAQQFASATSGPDGGGAGRQRSTSMRDYQLSVSTTAGIHNISVSGFINNYWFWKDSSLAGGIDATGGFLGTPTFADYYNTQGLQASDEFMFGRNDLTVGYSTWHQLQTGTRDDASGIGPDIPTGFFGEWSYFARDTYTFSNQVSFFLNAWMKHSSVTGRTTFDPRATLQFRPTRNDVVQFTYGRSDGAPSPQLKLVGTPVASDPGSSLTSVNCTGFNDVTKAGNPNLQSESANDFEVGIGHRFSGDSNIQVNAYVTAVTNQLFAASEPLSQFGVNNVVFAPGAMQTYLLKLQSQCPGQNITAANLLQFLSVSTTFNAAQALARGVEITGRQRLNHVAYIDYGYYIESSTHTGISDNILAGNPTVVNGAQIKGIPLHQATLSLDVAPGPWEFRMDNYYTEFNNGLSRPSYWHTDAFISRSLGKGTLLSLGGTNIFNNAVLTYGLIGLGTAPITNPVSGAAPRNSEEFGLAPATLTLTFQQKL
jgi:outer membrane receptor protein involved in Fe transport